MAAAGYGQAHDQTRVAKTGDTMTGDLVLSGDPVLPLGAATEQFVISHSGAGAVTSVNGQTGVVTLDFVDRNTSQAVSGVKTFASAPVVPAGSFPESAVSGLTADLAARLLAASNLSDLTSAAAARSNLGLGTAAVQPVSAFMLPGNNLSDVTSVGAARTSLGLGSAALLASGAVAQTANNLSDLASSASARTNLGLGGAAVLAVGTGANTVAAGDDSRIVGAVPKSTVTTKGDLIAATGAGVVSRLPVGSDGQGLVANSAASTGLSFATVNISGYRGTWSGATAYVPGDVVVLNNRAYMAVQANTGHSPMVLTQFQTAVPANIDSSDPAAYEMGMKFSPSQDLRLTAVAFYKATANMGTHVGRLWQLGANGVYYKVNEVTFTGETASGYQTMPLSADLSSGATYIVSCAFPLGHYSFDTHYFDSPVTVGSIVAPAGAGMFAQPPGTVPGTSSNNASYWVVPVWGEPNSAYWQEIGEWQLLPQYPSAQESAAAYVLSQIGANGGIAGLNGSGHLASTASGTATVTSGATSVTVAHGLPRTPTLQQVSVTATNNLGASTRFWVSAVDGTNLTVNVDVAPTSSSATFVWQIHNV